MRDISVKTGVPISSIRDVLVTSGIVLRTNKKSILNADKKTSKSFSGAIPYGYCLIQSQLVPDAKEQSVIQIILELWQSGKSFNAIKTHLNNQKVPSKLRRQWNDKTVKRIIKRETKKLKSTEEA